MPKNRIPDLSIAHLGMDPTSFTREQVEAKVGKHLVEQVKLADQFVVDGNKGTVVDWDLVENEHYCTYEYVLDVAWCDREGNDIGQNWLRQPEYLSKVRLAGDHEQGFPEPSVSNENDIEADVKIVPLFQQEHDDFDIEH